MKHKIIGTPICLLLTLDTNQSKSKHSHEISAEIIISKFPVKRVRVQKISRALEFTEPNEWMLVSGGKKCNLADRQTSIRLASRVRSSKQFRPALFQSLSWNYSRENSRLPKNSIDRRSLSPFCAILGGSAVLYEKKRKREREKERKKRGRSIYTEREPWQSLVSSNPAPRQQCEPAFCATVLERRAKIRVTAPFESGSRWHAV